MAKMCVLCQIGGRGISTVLSVTQIIQYKHYEILQLDWTSYEEISMQDPTKATLHGLRCQLALRRWRRSSARGLWESQAEGGWAMGIWKTWANLGPTQITQVRLMKDEGGRLRGYGYADFEDRDSLVGWLWSCCKISQNIAQIDVLSMTDLAVNNRKMRIDLASQVFTHE